MIVSLIRFLSEKDLAVELALGLAVGLAGGLAWGLAAGLGWGLAWVLAWGLACGLAVGRGCGLAVGRACGLAAGLVAGLGCFLSLPLIAFIISGPALEMPLLLLLVLITTEFFFWIDKEQPVKGESRILFTIKRKGIALVDGALTVIIGDGIATILLTQGDNVKNMIETITPMITRHAPLAGLITLGAILLILANSTKYTQKQKTEETK